jgi:ABC-type transporter MlaC component
MRQKLKKLSVKVVNQETPYEYVENMFKSWMGSFYKLLSKDQRKGLIDLYENLYDKTITIQNKKLVIK